jgi:ribosomal protein S18 acetylase RimI-like enzyme
MVSIERITPENVMVFKQVRLRALQDAPLAFGSTYQRERDLTDAGWLKRAENWNGENGIGFLALVDGQACGVAGSFVIEDDAKPAQLISMWTAPEFRRRGIGGLLVNAVIEWARPRGCKAVHLLVTSNNEAAIGFYSRLGFVLTGRTVPYPNDPALVEYEMSLRI